MDEKLYNLYKKISSCCSGSSFELDFDENKITKYIKKENKGKVVQDETILFEDFYGSDLEKEVKKIFNTDHVFLYLREYKKKKRTYYKLSINYDKIDIIFIAKREEYNNVGFYLEFKDVYTGNDIKEDNVFFERFDTKKLDDIFTKFKLFTLRKEKKINVVLSDYFRNNPIQNKINRLKKKIPS